MRSLQILSFAIALLLSAPTPAANAAPVLVGSYYEDNSAISCPEDNVCDATFNPPGRAKRADHARDLPRRN